MVIWSKPAQKDLRQIFEYIARDSRYYAKKAVNNMEVIRMSRFPPWVTFLLGTLFHWLNV